MLLAVTIAFAALFFANNLTKNLASEEKKKVELIALTLESVAKSTDENISYVESSILASNTTIPLFFTDQAGNVLGSNNIDSLLNENQLNSIKESHLPITIKIGENDTQLVYYGESMLLKQLRYFPFVLLIIMFLFLSIVYVYISTSNQQLHDRVWVGMSKETAHQLGTPLTSLFAWVELLKAENTSHETVNEIEKDLQRLQLIADRFSKIGSIPKLEEEKLLDHIRDIVAYMQKRASKNVVFSISSNKDEVLALISGSLFDWVIENIIRNSLDAMDGKGEIHIQVNDEVAQIIIDIQDTGKGISPQNTKKIFEPGFSTKKRGWGLGLSLAKRIIKEYHHGDIFVKKSELGKGTTFRIKLNK
ncbi:MAG TPA: HAMP domain-containing sensor histidine kinase [Chitinophagaceae bacterium]|nr:HAMP domain-containing sensor histidine kinase [Chitinophagaceae bacterium]